MRGTGYEAVVLHRKCPVTKQMQIIILEKILHIIEKKIIIKTSPFFYE